MTRVINNLGIRPHLKIGPLLDQYAYTFATDRSGIPGRGLFASRKTLAKFSHAVALIVSEIGVEAFMRELDLEERQQ